MIQFEEKKISFISQKKTEVSTIHSKKHFIHISEEDNTFKYRNIRNISKSTYKSPPLTSSKKNYNLEVDSWEKKGDFLSVFFS